MKKEDGKKERTKQRIKQKKEKKIDPKKRKKSWVESSRLPHPRMLQVENWGKKKNATSVIHFELVALASEIQDTLRRTHK